MESESVVDSRVESIRKQLVDLIVEAQLGTIDNIDKEEGPQLESFEQQEQDIILAHKNRGY